MTGTRGKRVQVLSTHHFSRAYSANVVGLRLGEYYFIGGRFVRFIRVTPKGYNFLDETTNCCILKHHVYETKKSIREKETRDDNLVRVRVSSWWSVYEVKSNVG